MINAQDTDKQDMLCNLRGTAEDSYLVQMLPVMKIYLDNIREIYPRKPIIIFTSQ